jgi:hypothetical protein
MVFIARRRVVYQHPAKFSGDSLFQKGRESFL